MPQHTLGSRTVTAVSADLSNHPSDRNQDLLRGSQLEMNRRIAATERRRGVRETRPAPTKSPTAPSRCGLPRCAESAAERKRDWGLVHQVLAALLHGTWTNNPGVATRVACTPPGGQGLRRLPVAKPLETGSDAGARRHGRRAGGR